MSKYEIGKCKHCGEEPEDNESDPLCTEVRGSCYIWTEEKEHNWQVTQKIMEMRENGSSIEEVREYAKQEYKKGGKR